MTVSSFTLFKSPPSMAVSKTSLWPGCAAVLTAFGAEGSGSSVGLEFSRRPSVPSMSWTGTSQRWLLVVGYLLLVIGSQPVGISGKYGAFGALSIMLALGSAFFTKSPSGGNNNLRSASASTSRLTGHRRAFQDRSIGFSSGL